MRHNQGKYIVGYATIRVTGRKPEQLMQLLMDLYIPIWNVVSLSPKKFEATIYLHHVEKVIELATTHNYEIYSDKTGGVIVQLKRILARKEWIVASVLSIIFLFLLSNTAWKIEITGVPPYLENSIEEKLEQVGLYEGAWTSNLTPIEEIQEQILHDIPELLYIGIKQNGTSYYVDAIEKKVEKPQQDLVGNALIAKKSGVIHKMFIKNGVALVERDDMVKKGDVLVTNEIDPIESEEKQEKDSKKIPVKGKVYANTWYNMKVSVSTEKSRASLTGEGVTHYQMQLGNITIPLWGWDDQPYENVITEYNTKKVRIWQWTLPVTFIQKDLHEYEANSIELSQKEVTEKTIKHLKERVKRQYGKDVEILKYYILHEAIENGKVKLNLYVSLLEDIAITISD